MQVGRDLEVVDRTDDSCGGRHDRSNPGGGRKAGEYRDPIRQCAETSVRKLVNMSAVAAVQAQFSLSEK